MHEVQRLDKWLWMARFYKTRPLAVAAIKGGHVQVNGERSKPGRGVHVGDELSIRKGIYTWRIEVTALAGRRGPAAEARTLYHESPQSIQQRETVRLEHKLASPAPAKRPDKQQRRKIVRFINKHEA